MDEPDCVKMFNIMNKQGEKENPYRKPPIGLYPKILWEQDRLYDIRSAIHRRLDAFADIPTKWLDEWNELIKKTGLD